MSAFILASDEGIYGIDKSIEMLQSERSGLDALEEGIKLIEQDPRALTVGLNGAPNILGIMEMDAAIMNGQTLQVGAVGALTGCKYPISAARKVMEVLPHVFLVGEGASKFAREAGIASADMLSPGALTKYQQWLAANMSTEQAENINQIPLAPFISFDARSNISRGTVTFLVRDKQGDLFAGVSTSGWAYKYPGRLGDSPIVGAGLYVDRRYGGATCTHTGEMTIRAGTARSVVLYMKKGATVEEACTEAIQDLADLKGGYLGPVVIHAVDNSGKIFVATNGGATPSPACYWNQEMTRYKLIEPTLIEG